MLSNDYPQKDKDVEALGELDAALDRFKMYKPNDRSELDGYYAIIITDLEKILAFAEKYIRWE